MGRYVPLAVMENRHVTSIADWTRQWGAGSGDLDRIRCIPSESDRTGDYNARSLPDPRRRVVPAWHVVNMAAEYRYWLAGSLHIHKRDGFRSKSRQLPRQFDPKVTHSRPVFPEKESNRS